ncbi:hypothetical protein VNO80_24762 [Phaseolus coccineus]|uniref:Uncharacterized protein n=1 Tax=Phaseolus coccineus TaxID=3886 RepID=A0AAN9QSN8_PHACN
MAFIEQIWECETMIVSFEKPLSLYVLKRFFATKSCTESARVSSARVPSPPRSSPLRSWNTLLRYVHGPFMAIPCAPKSNSPSRSQTRTILRTGSLCFIGLPLKPVTQTLHQTHCVSIKNTKEEYRKGLLNCKNNLHGRLILAKETQNLQPGLLRLSQWGKDSSPNKLLLALATMSKFWIDMADEGEISDHATQGQLADQDPDFNMSIIGDANLVGFPFGLSFAPACLF